MNEQTKTSSFTFKTLIRVLSVIAACLFFAPTFMISCSGQKIHMSAAKVMTGMKYQGETVTEAHFACILFLLIPIAIVVIWTIKLETSKQALITGICVVVDIIMWFAMSSEVKTTAESAGCEGKNTWLYWVNMLILIGIAALDVLMFLGKVNVEQDLVQAAQNVNQQRMMNQGQPMGQPVNNMNQGQPMGQPMNNMNQGQPMGQPMNNMNQGQPMGQPMNNMNQGQPMGQPAAPAVCKSCGAPLGAGNKFCMKCGAKVE